MLLCTFLRVQKDVDPILCGTYSDMHLIHRFLIPVCMKQKERPPKYYFVLYIGHTKTTDC